MQRATLREITFSVSQGTLKPFEKAYIVAWFILAIIIWGALMYLVSPLLKKQASAPSFATDITAYQAEIARLDQNLAETSSAALESQKLALQRQLLALTKKRGRAINTSMKLVIGLMFAGFIGGGIGLYALLGSPNIVSDISQSAANAPLLDTLDPETASVEQLLATLKQRLDTDRQDDPQGWLIYARTLMSVGQYDNAIEAYGRVLVLTENDARIADELARAKAFAANPELSQRGPNQDDIDAAAQMSPEARAAMINAMVDGLAARLKDNPGDVEGWIKLLKARAVLGQTDLLQADVADVQAAFADKPDVLASTLSAAGIESTENTGAPQ